MDLRYWNGKLQYRLFDKNMTPVFTDWIYVPEVNENKDVKKQADFFHKHRSFCEYLKKPQPKDSEKYEAIKKAAETIMKNNENSILGRTQPNDEAKCKHGMGHNFHCSFCAVDKISQVKGEEKWCSHWEYMGSGEWRCLGRFFRQGYTVNPPNYCDECGTQRPTSLEKKELWIILSEQFRGRGGEVRNLSIEFWKELAITVEEHYKNLQ